MRQTSLIRDVIYHQKSSKPFQGTITVGQIEVLAKLGLSAAEIKLLKSSEDASRRMGQRITHITAAIRAQGYELKDRDIRSANYFIAALERLGLSPEQFP